MAAPSMAVLLLLLVVVSAAAVAEAGSTVVAGMVFCDQCKDGARGLFDYPLYGARVAIQCGGGETPLTVRECNTNWFGGFSVRMEGSPDMNRCTARLLQGTPHCPGSGATSSAPPQRDLTLAFRMLGLALYTVQPLLSHPDHPMDFCPAAAAAPPDPAVAAAAPSSSVPVAPVSSPPAPVVPFWRRPRPRRLPPIWRRPPTIPQERPGLPEPETKPKPADAQLPPPPPPPPPTPIGSACTYDKWAVPEQRCHWKVVTPNTTVAMAFGPLAAQRYGADMTLRDALDGRGDMYRTLLREATAALLNAYYNPPAAASSAFLYPTTASVIDHLNGALLSASTQRVLIEGARFRRANAGGGGPAGRTKLPCDFTPCNTTTTS